MAGRCGCSASGPTTPEEIIDIIGLRALCQGQGLEYDEIQRCIRIALAQDANLEFDPFGRLRNTCCDDSVDPQPQACVKTVDQLPDFVVSGQGGGAALLHPYGSQQGIDYAIDHSLDIISNDTFSTTDEIATWALYGPDVFLHGYTDTTSSTLTGADIASHEWINLLVDAGTRDNPTSDGAYAPEELKEPYGGWYGFFAPQYHPQTLANVMRGLSKRAVTWANIAYSSTDAELNQRNLRAALKAVSVACNADSTILAVHSDMAPRVPDIINAQVTPAINISSTDFTPQMVIDAGVEWVRISGNRSDGAIQPYVDAGLQVILYTNSRQWITQKAIDLGARGITAWDPVYARGIVDPVFQYYRRNEAKYYLKQTDLGALTHMTDDLSLISGRSFHKESEAGMFIWVTTARLRNAVLIGEVCPLPSPADDSYTFRVQVDHYSPGEQLPDGNGPKIGVIICGATDVDPTELEGDHVGYACFIRVGVSGVQGELVIAKYNAGGPYEELAASTTMEPVTFNDWVDLRVDVTATTITLTRTDTGTPYSVTATDSDYRGPYVHWMANSTEPDGRFLAGVRQFLVASISGAADDAEVEGVPVSRNVLPASGDFPDETP